MTTLLLIMSCLLQVPDTPQHLKPTRLHNGALNDSANWGWYHPSSKSGGVLEHSGAARLIELKDTSSEYGSGQALLLEPQASAVLNLADARNRPLVLHPGGTYDISWSQRSEAGSKLVVMLLDGEMTTKATMHAEGTGDRAWRRRHATFQIPEDAPKNMPYMVVFENSAPEVEGTSTTEDDGSDATLIDDVSLAIIRNDSSDFESLFDGTTLTGWTGAIGGYEPLDGAITCNTDAQFGGNLLTEEQFDDFVLRFEFKLFPGSNNGIALRAPLEGDPAYAGMESQILDNADPRYKGIKPWQRHGSIYGITPALPGYQRPVGGWNTQEIRLQGRRVSITLNGTLILDCNLDEVASTGTLSGQKHPGLARKSGHIGFCGHGDAVAYRSIRLKKLGSPPKSATEE